MTQVQSMHAHYLLLNQQSQFMKVRENFIHKHISPIFSSDKIEVILSE